MRIFLLRHGEVAGNREQRYIGRTDQPLSESGREQALALAAPRVDRVYTSPYLRCRQTAELVFPYLQPIVCDTLRECDFGIFEGKTAAEMASSPEYSAWVAGGCLDPIPGGESIPAFAERCAEAFADIVRAESGHSESLALVVHGGVIMALLSRFDRSPRDFFSYRVGNCQYICCDCEVRDGLTLSIIGDAAC